MLCWSSSHHEIALEELKPRSDTARQRNRRTKSTTCIDHQRVHLHTRFEISSSDAALRRLRPFSAGDVDDLRVATIAGFTQNTSGKWIFKVNVGASASFTPLERGGECETTCYTIRRRFSDFKLLHEGLLACGLRRLPPLPAHGVVSFFEMKLRPEQVVERRAQALQQLLECINSNPLLASTEHYSDFIGTDPLSQQNGYVSLAAYEAPVTAITASIIQSPQKKQEQQQQDQQDQQMVP